jgi:four helix bundle protein
MNRSELKQRTQTFAHRCVKFGNSLPETKLGRHIQGQLIRCSTSVAVNYRAVLLAHSESAFAAKLSIVIEEADECGFWMEFAVEEQLISREKAELLLQEAKELTAIFISSRKTIQLRNKK